VIILKRILILEDNNIAVEHLKKLIDELEVKCEVYATDQLRSAYQYILDNNIDLFIIDIILDTSKPGDISGLEFVNNLRKIAKYEFTPVIFITSLEDSKFYTYDKLQCQRYIEKPFDSNVVKKTIDKCLRFPKKELEEKNLFFRKDGILVMVEIDKLVYAECNNHIMHFHMDNGDILKVPYVTLKELLSKTADYNIFQSRRNTLVNKAFVRNVDNTNGVIQLKDNHGRVEIGVMYRKHVKEIFQ